MAARAGPFDVELVTLGKEGEEAREVADRLYDGARRGGARRALRRPRGRAPARSSPTPSCSGCPLRLTVGKKGVEAGELEVQVRRGQEKRTLPLDGAAARGRGAVARPSLTRRRLLGLDRSGPPPPETLRGRAAAPLDAPERDRLRAPRAGAGLPRGRAQLGRRPRRHGVGALRGHRRQRLPRRHGRAPHGPVQPPGHAARPAHRPPARGLGRGRHVALRAAAALGARGAGGPRAGDARAHARSPCAAGWT